MSLYDENFYNKIDSGSFESAQVILPLLFNIYMPSSMIDIGAGSGAWVSSAHIQGIKSIQAIDGSDFGMFGLDKGTFNFKIIDFEKTNCFKDIEKSEFLSCLEVAEHLSPKRADSFIKELCELAPVILFSAAIPYQGGIGHQNENWPEYWANIFHRNDFACFDILRNTIWNNPSVEWWYRQNVFVFVDIRSEIYQQFLNIRKPENNGSILTRIHPELYLLAVQRNNETVQNSLGQDQYFLRESLKWVAPNVAFNYGSEFES